MVKNFFNQSKGLLARRQTNILSAAAVITLASFFSSLLGLARNRILVSMFFENPTLREQLDAYWVAFRLPELMFQLLVIGALSAAFIPVFSKYLKKDSKEAYDISSSVLNIILVLFLIVSAVVFIFAEKFSEGITSANFSYEQVVLTANLTRIMLVAQFFFAVSNFFTGMIQSQHRFLIPALSPIVYNIGIIGGILLLSPLIGIYAAAIGVVVGAFLHLIFQFPLAKKLGFRYKFVVYWKHSGVKEMIRLMPPRTLAIAVNQLELFGFVFLATSLPVGNLTIFNLAQQLMSAPTRIFSVPIGQASLPFLAEETSGEKLDNFKKTLKSSLHQILFLAFPAGVLLLVLRIPLVRIVYGAKEFPWSATLLTGRVVAILSFSVFAQSAVHILTRAFYALHNTKIPFVMALISVIINILMATVLVFVYKLGVLGLAVAMSVSSVIHVIGLFYGLNKVISGFLTRELLVPPVKMIVATIVMGIFLWIPMKLLDQFVFDTTRTVPLVLLTVIVCLTGAVVYITISKMLKVYELQSFKVLVKKVGNWKRVLNQTEEVLESTSQTHEMKPL